MTLYSSPLVREYFHRLNQFLEQKNKEKLPLSIDQCVLYATEINYYNEGLMDLQPEVSYHYGNNGQTQVLHEQAKLVHLAAWMCKTNPNFAALVDQ